MPNTKTSARKRAALTPSSDVTAPPDLVRAHADALFRCATECCHQHDRYSRVLDRSPIPIEDRAAQELCRICDTTLADLVDAYEKALGAAPPPKNEPWLRPANSLWLASREFSRRYSGTDAMARNLGRHSADEFEALHAEFELAASALLALRHACEAYQRVRPEAL
jgi:hypothetical protein